MKNFIVYISAIFLATSCTEHKRLIKKAEMATGEVRYQKALNYYDQALELDKDSYRANLGKGMLLSEFMEQHEAAIPFLEKALNLSPKDTMHRIKYNLGKGYHHTGEYSKALYYYKSAFPAVRKEDPASEDYLRKRISDCEYALTNTVIAPVEKQNIKNLGKVINSEFPEYAAVAAGNDLFFTARKKDDENERVNGWDGKYFESIYIATKENDHFFAPVRYTVPYKEENSKFQKRNEAVISASKDGKTLFIYRDGKIYETSLEDRTSEATEMDKMINFTRFQNHASISGDGKKLFFTSESKDGTGGTDLYQSVKNSDEKWSTPEIIATLNTPFDEESPFFSGDGTLYFSSNGLPGYGGYDVYKSRFENGKWSVPENLGQPINSPGDDLFFVLEKNSPDGYYSSNRTGGFGDMDIYRVHYVSGQIEECKPLAEPLIAINYAKSTDETPAYYITLQIPPDYEKNIQSFAWSLNDTALKQSSQQFQYKFENPGNYKISAKISVQCDTCSGNQFFCAEKIIMVTDDHELAQNDSIEDFNGNEYLDQEELLSINWNISPLYFGYDQYTLSDDAREILDQNINVLKMNKQYVIDISGHTDARGNADYNMKLSARRANTVREYILNKGILKKRIVATYIMGESNLVNNCSDDTECDERQHQMNRRVEVNVMPAKPAKILTLK